MSRSLESKGVKIGGASVETDSAGEGLEAEAEAEAEAAAADRGGLDVDDEEGGGGGGEGEGNDAGIMAGFWSSGRLWVPGIP